ncbi:uroporphyrinogen-III synthase [Methanolobus sp.]|uniref:uroporphyrinogen-III synthase n=1 Tax=Methanolobus sp. TaxID=1874737 RepID=UPI0025E02FD5|nr:uroporphyrinogen-III synthase [Methanolobus sp.]
MAENTKKPVIAIMRPERYIKESVELARSMDFDTFTVPMVEITDMKDEFFDGFVERVLDGRADYVIFTSANGIDFTMSKISAESRENFIDALNRTKVIAIGPTTSKALEKAGVKVMGMPGVYSSEGIVDYLRDYVAGRVVDTARSFYGSEHLVEGLRSCGAVVNQTQVYTLEKPAGNEQDKLIDATINGEIAAFAFTSSMMVHNFFEHARSRVSEEQVVSALNNVIVAAIGGPTAQTLEGYGVKVSVIPDKFIFEEVLKSIKERLS